MKTKRIGICLSLLLLYGFVASSVAAQNPTAVKAVPYTQEEVRYKNGNVSLAGTLFVPGTRAPHPAIVFHHGAYEDTRAVWRFYADHFAQRGNACLIYDNRGSGDSTGGVGALI